MDYIKGVKNFDCKIYEYMQIIGLLNDSNLKFDLKGEQLQGNCPFKLHGGDRNSKGFALNVVKDIYICHTHCGKGEGLIDFYCDCNGYSRTDGRAVHQACRTLYSKLYQYFGENKPLSQHRISIQKKNDTSIQSEVKTNPTKNINLSLDYSPKEILQSKNLTSETLKAFDSGIATYGSLKNRFAVAVHNKDGQKIGYAGQDLEKGEWLFFFNKSLELFNYHRVNQLKDINFVIVVESFYSAMYLTQCGYPNVVSGFGRYLNENQLQLISELSKNMILFFDNDEAGKKAVQSFKVGYNSNLNVQFFDYATLTALKPYQMPELVLQSKLNRQF